MGMMSARRSGATHLACKAIPTLIVLDAERHELLRIAGGMDLTQYTTVLDSALADVQPAQVALEKAARGGALQGGDCRRLAYNAWALDDLTARDDADEARNLSAAAAACSADSLAHARLQIFAAYFATAAQPDAKVRGVAHEPATAQVSQSVRDVQSILADPTLALSVSDALQYLGEDFFKAVRAQGAKPAAAFRDAYVAVMDAAANDTHFAEADQLAAIGSKLQALQMLSEGVLVASTPAASAAHAALPLEVAREARRRVDTALAGARDPYIRSGLINAALPIYDALHQNEDAYRVVQAEIANSKTPYYFEADLAELAETLGHKGDALRLFERAYHDSKGAATRFQWGELYLSGLLRLAPQDSGRIRTVGTEVLGELDGSDRIYRRSHRRLEMLDRDLRAWDGHSRAQRDVVIHDLRTRMRQICVKIPDTEPARSSCEAFLQPSA
jgi:protein disulfide-isomerase